MSDDDTRRPSPGRTRPSPFSGRPWWWWALAGLCAVGVVGSMLMLSI